MLTHRIVAYLITLAVGYWILTKAENEKDFTKIIGRVIAWIIIVVSLLGPVCAVTSAVCRNHDSTACGSQNPWAGGGWSHHDMDGCGMMNGQCPFGGNKMMKNQDGSTGKEKTDKP
jgi:hypothetical protein